MRRRRLIIALAAAPALIWVAFASVLWAMQDAMVFAASRWGAAPDNGFEARRWSPANVDDARLQGWRFPAPPDGAGLTLVFFGGNGEDIAASLPRLAGWRDRTGAAVAAVNYRGYGRSGGRPSEATVIEDAGRILAALWQGGEAAPERTVVVGHSLGSAVAMQMAARHDLAGVVLITPFDSIRALAQRRFPWLPVGWLLRHPFDSAAVAPQVGEPVMVVYAEHDQVVPHPHTDALVKAFGRDVEVVRIPGGRHSAYGGANGEFIAALADFFKRLGG